MIRNDCDRRRSRFRFKGFFCSDCYILPGFTDVHVHLREPGFSYKETVRTGTMAAAAGGFTDIVSMPNLEPCPDCLPNLQKQRDIIQQDALVNVHPCGAITVGEEGNAISSMDDMAPFLIGFSDDGVGVASDEVMKAAMSKARSLDRIILAHCEDRDYTRQSSEAEWKQLERDLKLAEETGCRYHMCHLSCRESVELIRAAKKKGLDVSCETAPHYLLLSREMIYDDGKFKMNPPLKERKDRQALIEAVRDGTIDMIATDHAPHSREEKSGGMKNSTYGIVGLETAFPLLYTKLVLTGIISFDRLIELMYVNPGKRFGLKRADIEDELRSENPTFTVWNLDEEYSIDPEKFFSKGRSTPFEGITVRGRCLATVIEGNLVWERNEENEDENFKDRIK
ncbi:MAG: dihydroorotase [Clostridiales bacterium]|nr:dihydroorotase [Clostridiales bacterium]